MKEITSGFSIDADPLAQEESLPASALRNTARTAARVGETLLGLPGDIAQAGTSALNLGLKGSNWLRSKVGLPEEEPFSQKTILPTSEDVKTHVTGNIEKVLPKDYLKAKTPGEQFSDEFFSDLTSLITPVPGFGRLPIKRALAVSGLGNLASWASKDLGADTGTQTGIKIGTMLATTMAGKGKLNSTKKALYNSAESNIPETAMVKNKLTPIYNKLELAIEKGSKDAPSKKFIKDRLEDISQNIVGEKMNIKNVLELKKDWNELRYTSGIPKRAEHSFKELNNSLHSMIEEYGKSNKAFYEPWKRAEDIHQGLSKASKLNSWMQKNITPFKIGTAASTLLLGQMVHLPHGLSGATAGLLATTVGTKYGVRAFEALKNSPEIRKYYANTIASAAKKNVAATVKNAQKLNKVLEKKIDELEPKEGFSIE